MIYRPRERLTFLDVPELRTSFKMGRFLEANRVWQVVLQLRDLLFSCAHFDAPPPTPGVGGVWLSAKGRVVQPRGAGVRAWHQSRFDGSRANQAANCHRAPAVIPACLSVKCLTPTTR